ncbi:MAG: LytR/AlgR family response regulator transcription factor [Peptococcaceae bacterium]
MIPVRAIIVDPDSQMHFLLRSVLQEIEDLVITGVASNTGDALKLVQEQKPDIVFLEMLLPDTEGIELAKTLRKINPDLFLVFISANKEYALEAFRIYAYDYILKPLDKERLITTVQRIQNIIKEKSLANLAHHLQTARISINLGNERVFVRLSDINYLEKSGRYTIIHTVNGVFKTRDTLQDFERRLGISYYRSHKSFIINIERVERIINFPGSSYFEVKFKNYDKCALLSRDKVNGLMNILEPI